MRMQSLKIAAQMAIHCCHRHQTKILALRLTCRVRWQGEEQHAAQEAGGVQGGVHAHAEPENCSADGNNTAVIDIRLRFWHFA